jgi:hypothetical protein
MPLRIVSVFGPPFGGFRVAFRAGVFGLDWPAGFEVLEQAVLRELRLFASLSPERRARLREDPLPPHPGPQIGNRTGVVDGAIASEGPSGTRIVMCASFPFSVWPFGGWAVFEAGTVTPEGQLILVSHDELQNYW